MEEAEVVEQFYGVYLLKSLNPKYYGRTYIGYTVDPNRRIKQHNKGKHHGGAWKTSKKGPWEMALIVHGFPSDVAALRFEWAWQHPKRSRRLKTVAFCKKSTESSFTYCLKVMYLMLRTPPWSRLPLTVRWLSADVVDPPVNLVPPVHIPILYGPVLPKKINSSKNKRQINEEDTQETEIRFCQLCNEFLEEKNCLVCLNKLCQACWHIVCLAKHFLVNETSHIKAQYENHEITNILPVEGSCTKCKNVLLWGDLIRKKKGCYSHLNDVEENFIDENV